MQALRFAQCNYANVQLLTTTNVVKSWNRTQFIHCGRIISFSTIVLGKSLEHHCRSNVHMQLRKHVVHGGVRYTSKKILQNGHT